MNNKDIIAQLREGADKMLTFAGSKTEHPSCAIARNMRTLASRLEAEPASPTLASLVTPRYADYLLDRICDRQSQPPWSDSMRGSCDECDGPGTEGCHPLCRELDALWTRAKEGK